MNPIAPDRTDPEPTLPTADTPLDALASADFTGRLVEIARRWQHPRPEEAARAAGIAFTDTVACAIAGLSDPGVAAFVRATGHAPFAADSPVADHARATGLAAHALDYDDVDDATISHPSAAMVPALLAVGADRRASGADIVTAFHRGLVVGRLLGAALGVRSHYEDGWHTTSTLGTVAAAAAVGSVLGLDENGMRAALGIAGSLAQGSRQNFGTMTKPLHAGAAAHSAVLAASLAEQGFTADDQLLEGPLGFIALHRGQSSAPPVTDADIATPFLNVKLYPCCYYTHAAADAVSELREDLVTDAVDPTSIASLRVTVQPGGLAPLIHPQPSDGTQAKFSMEYVAAAMLFDGAVTLASFEPASVARPALQELLATVTKAEAEVPPVGPAGWTAGYAVVVATLADGRTFSRRVDRPRGHATRPVDDATLRAKFDDCLTAAGVPLTGTNGEATADGSALFDALVTIADQRSVSDVAQHITTVLADRPDQEAAQ
ncbi:MmgE/PrpD family protein [Brevibacterium jeotgali]|uniref:2-methylcitrate dehydratase PrpD n=1 Tax=Brevibacterium jeotgali TaxID=1262550 RepID=A0A2H1L2I5_9MICO|nr:MmgE/PrpD family protein [Brevibacterium jeotgali]TWC03069.1 2-methylcitrate dehydratase PrpD [Brevibacterium jeotgali]SMY11092.1 2-methylcitrate dehydratase PrpD [Brevibacterium jeotgali]